MSNEWINILCRNHKEWVNIVRSFGENYYAEDIVQEMYLRIARYKKQEKCIVGNEPNRGYIWLILKNSYIDFEKYKQKNVKVPLYEIDNLSFEENEESMYTSFDIIQEKIYIEINSWHEYDKRLFYLYLKNKTSMRKIAKGADISPTSIFNTLKNCKERLRIKCGEDYEDYLNEEYNLIK